VYARVGGKFHHLERQLEVAHDGVPDVFDAGAVDAHVVRFEDTPVQIER